MNNSLDEYNKIFAALGIFIFVILSWEIFWIGKLYQSYNQIKLLAVQTKNEIIVSNIEKVQLDYQEIKKKLGEQNNIFSKIIIFSYFGQIKKAQIISDKANQIIVKNDSRINKMLSFLNQDKVYSDWTDEQRTVFWAEISQIARNISQENITADDKYKLWLELAQKAPQILGINNTQRYLVLFQNNTEIRPSGGFWGAHASLIVKNGIAKAAESEELPAIEVGDQATMPVDISNILESNKDSQKTIHFINSVSDIPEVIKTALPIIEKNDGINYDGVILVDMIAISDLLKIVGLIQIDGAGEITDQNIWEKLVYIPENKENSGKVDKPKNQLGSVGVELINKLSSQPVSTIAQWLNMQFSHKHIIINSEDKELASIFKEINIDGSNNLPENNYLIYEELNFSGKQSLFLDRKIKMEKTGELKYKIAISFNYRDSELARDQYRVENRSLIRLRTPKNSKLVSSFGGYQTDSNQFETLGTSAFSNILQINPGETKELVFEYQLPEKSKNEYRKNATPKIIFQPGLPKVEIIK